MLFEILLFLIIGVFLRDLYYFLLYLISLTQKKPREEYTGEYTIIIPHYNEEDVGLCLTSVYPDTIVVVDDGSDNKRILREWEDKVAIHYLNHQGKYHALNYGVAHSSGDVVLLDADTIVKEGALEELLSYLEKYDAVAGNIQVRKETTVISRIQAIEHLRIAMFKRVMAFRSKITFIPGPFAAFKRRVLENEQFKKSKVEDLTLSERIKEKFALTYAPEAVVYTTMPNTLTALYQQRKYWARGNIEEFRNNIGKLLSSYLLTIADILILLLSFLSWNFFPLFFLLVFESFTMVVANRGEKGNCTYESLLFPFFMYFLAFFYSIAYIAAFIEYWRESL